MKAHIFWGACALASLLFIGFLSGRTVVNKLRGKTTVQEVVKALEDQEKTKIKTRDLERLILVGLKEEKLLEVYGRTESGETRLITTFPFTGFSGTLGPKLREGDGQIPEGIYEVEYLNPNSSYHLSIKLNYPNDFDRQMGKRDGRTQLGYDIFIHGKSATIGCIPIGDPAIEDLFLAVSEIGIGNVVVILAPCDFRRGKSNPDIPGIEWEDELYEQIRQELKRVGYRNN